MRLIPALRASVGVAAAAATLALSGCSFTTTAQPSSSAAPESAAPAQTAESSSAPAPGSPASAPTAQSSSSAAPESAATAPTAESDAEAPSEEAAATPTDAPTDLAGLVSAFVDAGLIEQAATYPLAFDGIASDATGADDSGGGSVEFYYVDRATASDAVLANYDLAKSEGTVDYGGGILVPIDDVAGPFMITYSRASDAAGLQAEWEKITAGLE